MKAEIITIGDELLIGQVVNTNAAYIGRALSILGISAVRETTVGDDLQYILKEFRRAWNESDVIIVTGGLGLIRTQIDGGSLTGTNVLSHNNMFGWDLGAGVMGYFNDHVGLRGDFKYLRGFEDQATGVVVIDANGPGQFHFWRAAIGVVFR